MNMPLFNFKKWILALGIAIVFNLFISYAISTVYPEPTYESYCNSTAYGPKTSPYPERYPGEFYNQNITCPTYTFNGTMERECGQAGGYVDYERDEKACPVKAYCQMCQKLYDDDKKKYDANVFIILIGFGALTVIGGIFITVESVGAGFLIGGILMIIIGAMRSWSNLHEYIRLLFLGLALALLIFVGYKKIK